MIKMLKGTIMRSSHNNASMSVGHLSNPYTPQASGTTMDDNCSEESYNDGEIELKENKTRDSKKIMYIILYIYIYIKYIYIYIYIYIYMKLYIKKKEIDIKIYRGFTVRLAYLRHKETILIRPRIIMMEASLAFDIKGRENFSRSLR